MSLEGKVQEKIEVKKPEMYMVLLHNDDFTPRGFVVDVLLKFFHMTESLAQNVMLTAHVKGKASCGRFTKETAETKLLQIQSHISNYDYPLSFSIEQV